MPATPHRKPALSLAYDSGDRSHLEIAVPALTSRNLAGTFFLPSIPLVEQARSWQAASNQGHEVGSHSLDGFTDERGNLPNWTLEMVEEDLRMSRKLLTELFPSQTDFAFTYPGDQFGCVEAAYNPAPTEYGPVVDRLFRVSRTAEAGWNDLNALEIQRLRSIDAFGLSYAELVELVEKAVAHGSWLILGFRGIGSGDLAMDSREHELFLDFLAHHAREIDLVTICRFALQTANASALYSDL